MYNLTLPPIKQPTEDFNFNYITTNAQAEMALASLKLEEVLCVDTETTGLDPTLSKVHLVQIGNPHKMFVFDAHRVDIKRIFKGLLEDPKILKILQNALFDYKMLKYHFDIELTNIYDTMLAEIVITCGVYAGLEARKQASLAVLAKKYINIDLNKKIREDFPEQPVGFDFNKRQDLLKYAALDTYYPAYIYKTQRTQVIERGLIEAVKSEFDLIPVVADLELTGVLIDVPKWKRFLEENERKLYKLDSDIQKIGNKVNPQKTLWDDAPGTNISSPAQLQMLFARMGHVLVDTAHDTLLDYYSTHPDAEIFGKILEYRVSDKLNSSYGLDSLAKVNPNDGRMRVNFNQLGASSTSRFSSSGPNLQQIPTRPIETEDGEKLYLRDCFIAGPGRKFIAGDYSQQEVRIAAHIFDEPVLRKTYEEGKDVYRAVAALMFGKDYDDIEKGSFERQIAKTIVLASNYGGGPDPIVRQLLEGGTRITKAEAKNHLKKYIESFPDMAKNQKRLIDKCIKLGYVEFHYGKKRYLWDLIKQLDGKSPKSDEYRDIMGQLERRIKNTPVQGNAAVMTKIALKRVYNRIKSEGLDAHLCLVIHDELVIEAAERDADHVSVILKEEMEAAFQEVCPGFPNKTDTIISDKWIKD